MYENKPRSYDERRRWQDAQRAAGVPVECGREVCKVTFTEGYVNSGTPLLYCPTCAALINRFNPGLCSKEHVPVAPT